MTAPPPDTVKDKESWRDVVGVDENGQGLTDWEILYVANLMFKLKSGCTLTAKQVTVLHKIAEDRLP